MKQALIVFAIVHSLFASEIPKTEEVNTTAQVVDGPKIFIDEPTKDFGFLEFEGKPLVMKHTYVVVNTGNDTLRIQRVKPGCSCTVVDFTKVIAPGDSGTIGSSLKMTKGGHYNKSITVFSNAINEKRKTLRLQADLLSPVNISHRYLMLRSTDNVYRDIITISAKEPALQITSAYYKKRTDEENTESLPFEFHMQEKSSIPENSYTKLKKLSNSYLEHKEQLLKHSLPHTEKYLRITEFEEAVETLSVTEKKVYKELLKNYKKLTKEYVKVFGNNATTEERSISSLLSELEKGYAMGYHQFELAFSIPLKLEYSEPGTIYFETNSKEKPVIKIPCLLEPK